SGGLRRRGSCGRSLRGARSDGVGVGERVGSGAEVEDRRRAAEVGDERRDRGVLARDLERERPVGARRDLGDAAVDDGPVDGMVAQRTRELTRGTAVLTDADGDDAARVTSPRAFEGGGARTVAQRRPDEASGRRMLRPREDVVLVTMLDDATVL